MYHKVHTDVVSLVHLLLYSSCSEYISSSRPNCQALIKVFPTQIQRSLLPYDLCSLRLVETPTDRAPVIFWPVGPEWNP